MFKQVLRLSGSCNQVLSGAQRRATNVCPEVIRHQCIHSLSAAPNTRKWDLYSAVCLERHPIVIQPMNDLEQKFYDTLKKVEFENSLRCDHELKVEKEKRQQSSNTDDLDINTDNISIQTMQDFEDNNREELNSFKFAPRSTEFDEQKIMSSLKRKLDKNLLLLIHQKVGDAYHWIPPQGIRQEGETMRETAERILQDTCGTNMQAKFYGNAPIGFYKYKYPEKIREEGIHGVKVFYFLAKYIDGDITADVKHQWLDHEELEKTLPSQMQKSISQFMLSI